MFVYAVFMQYVWTYKFAMNVQFSFVFEKDKERKERWIFFLESVIFHPVFDKSFVMCK